MRSEGRWKSRENREKMREKEKGATRRGDRWMGLRPLIRRRQSSDEFGWVAYGGVWSPSGSRLGFLQLGRRGKLWQISEIPVAKLDVAVFVMNCIADSVTAVVGFIDPVVLVFGGNACVRLVVCDLN
ncbi:hypothetical protein F0562_022635 [Nyssa sinensis]|uniref:Uncharacterized protein n=1 Tax=Nyssa sinensis TaxID=561372 RepID=A0A5J5BNA1_9ASTE|nr:hypothetical protein F0562_022635 [Nyssa sinensis]